MSAETKTNKKINIIILAVLAILLTLYILSFTKSCSSTDKREVIKTALVNKKYEDKITMFQLQGNGEIITLQKKNDNWYIVDNYNENITLPASKERIDLFIKDLITVQNMYKISDNLDKNSAFGLTDSSAFYIRYYFDDSFNDIIFGNQDFALSSRYMMSGKSTTVYEVSNIFDKYLTASVQSWSEPFIISKNQLGEIKPEDVQRTLVTYENKTKQIDFPAKLLDLRQGGLPSPEYFSLEIMENPIMEIKLELGNKNQINLKICQSARSAEQEYFVGTEYVAMKDGKKSSYTSYSKISGWTYNKIKEVTL